MNNNLSLDKIQGAFIGLALGDALGIPFETMTPKKILEVTNGKGVEGFDHGVIRTTKDGKKIANYSLSDDTQMSCCIAESLIRCKKFNLLDQTLSHIRELETCTEGWGSAHREGLLEIKKYFDSRGTQGRSYLVPVPFEKGKGAGNGVAMKIFPLIMFQTLRDNNSWKYIEKQIAQIAGLTHGDRRAWAAAASLYYLFFDIIHLDDIIDESSISKICFKLKYFENKYKSNKQKKFSSYLNKINKEHLTMSLFDLSKDLGTSCIATESVVFAIACILRNPYDFEKSLLEAVNAGGDTDTIAAIVGAFVGYNVGYSNIPQKWRTILPQTNYLIDLSNRFIMF